MNTSYRAPLTVVELLLLHCLLSHSLKFYQYVNYFRLMFITVGIQLFMPQTCSSKDVIRERTSSHAAALMEALPPRPSPQIC